MNKVNFENSYVQNNAYRFLDENFVRLSYLLNGFFRNLMMTVSLLMTAAVTYHLDNKLNHRSYLFSPLITDHVS